MYISATSELLTRMKTAERFAVVHMLMMVKVEDCGRVSAWGVGRREEGGRGKRGKVVLEGKVS